MIPYINFEELDYNKGMTMFAETPRYSTGYAALFQTFGFMPETHMLKPYSERVKATYDLLQPFIETATSEAPDIISIVQKSRNDIQKQTLFPLKWIPDSSRSVTVNFKAYEKDYNKSEATDLSKIFYNHNKPVDVKFNVYDHFTGMDKIKKPTAYIIHHSARLV